MRGEQNRIMDFQYKVMDILLTRWVERWQKSMFPLNVFSKRLKLRVVLSNLKRGEWIIFSVIGEEVETVLQSVLKD